MGCCMSSENDYYEYEPQFHQKEVIIRDDTIMDISRYIPYHHLQQKPIVNLTLNDPKILSLTKQLEQHAIFLKAHQQIPLQIRQYIQKITDHLIRNNSMSILNSWGIIFEYEYRPIYTLKVAPTDKKPETRLVLIIDIDKLIHMSAGIRYERFH
jgi:hypothetical protein